MIRLLLRILKLPKSLLTSVPDESHAAVHLDRLVAHVPRVLLPIQTIFKLPPPTFSKILPAPIQKTAHRRGHLRDGRLQLVLRDAAVHVGREDVHERLGSVESAREGCGAILDDCTKELSLTRAS